MRQVIRLYVGAFLLAAVSAFGGPIVYDPSLYSFLVVTSEGTQPAINNLGEIVYQKFTWSGRERIISTTRGDLTPSSDEWAARFPSINDLGEVVFHGTTGNLPWSVFSTTRGRLGDGGSPGINNFGETVHAMTQFFPNEIRSSTQGNFEFPTNGWSSLRMCLNNFGEIVYDRLDPNFVVQLYSTTRGQLTTNGGYFPALNNHGDVLYVNKVSDSDEFAVYALEGPRLTNFRVNRMKVLRHVSMNDHGDFVFTVASANSHQIVLATQRPNFYPQYSTFDPINLVWPPRIRMASKLPATFTLRGLVGLNYRIEYTENYQSGVTNTWNTLTNLNLPTSPITITHPTVISPGQRFYRAVWLRDPDLL